MVNQSEESVLVSCDWIFVCLPCRQESCVRISNGSYFTINLMVWKIIELIELVQRIKKRESLSDNDIVSMSLMY